MTKRKLPPPLPADADGEWALSAVFGDAVEMVDPEEADGHTCDLARRIEERSSTAAKLMVYARNELRDEMCCVQAA